MIASYPGQPGYEARHDIYCCSLEPKGLETKTLCISGWEDVQLGYFTQGKAITPSSCTWLSALLLTACHSGFCTFAMVV